MQESPASAGLSFQRELQMKELAGSTLNERKKIKLTNGRRMVSDLIGVANKMPLIGMMREFDLSDLVALRRIVRPRISWNVIVMKAYSIVGESMPILRQCYTAWPKPYLYQHHQDVCLLTVAREYENEERLFFARFNCPNQHSLVQLQQQYDDYRRKPVEEISQFRCQINFSKTPSLIRRFAWGALYNWWPQKRCSHMGTFGMTLSGYKGGYFAQHLSPNTTSLGVDPHPRNGKGKILLTFDHRVIDGKPCADIFENLNKALMQPIANEFKHMARQQGINPEEALAKANSNTSIRRAA